MHSQKYSTVITSKCLKTFSSCSCNVERFTEYTHHSSSCIVSISFGLCILLGVLKVTDCLAGQGCQRLAEAHNTPGRGHALICYRRYQPQHIILCSSVAATGSAWLEPHKGLLVPECHCHAGLGHLPSAQSARSKRSIYGCRATQGCA